MADAMVTVLSPRGMVGSMGRRIVRSTIQSIDARIYACPVEWVYTVRVSETLVSFAQTISDRDIGDHCGCIGMSLEEKLFPPLSFYASNIPPSALSFNWTSLAYPF